MEDEILNETAGAANEGLGLADAAGLTDGQAHYSFFESFWHYFQNDLISSIPITICSILVVAVVIERSLFYSRNNRDISRFIQNLQAQLEKGNLEAAQMLAAQLNSVTGEIAEEGIRLLAVQKEDFSRAYDLTSSLVTRKLQKYLPILATVGAVAPFLGLFGTVSGVIKALFHMSQGVEGASLSMIGEISNALIATGYGLAIAIISVVSYNLFGNIVKRYGDDFMLLKLLFLSFSQIDFKSNSSFFEQSAAPRAAQSIYSNAYQQQQQDLGQQHIDNMMKQQQQQPPQDKPPYPDFLR